MYVTRMSNTQTSPVVRLKADAYAAWMDRLRLASAREQAQYLGVSRANLAKVRKGEVKPGEEFIAAVLSVTGAKFEKFFELAS